MAVLVREHAYAPRERSFVISGMDSGLINGYVQYSPTSDFSEIYGTQTYGFQPSDAGVNQYHYNHVVFVDPRAGGPGDIIYWRIKENLSGTTRSSRTVRLKRPRTHQSGWNFVVGGSACDLSGGSVGLSDNCKQFCIPTALALNPDILCIPGDAINASNNFTLSAALTEYQTLRQDFTTTGVNIPILSSPGDEEAESVLNNKNARRRLFPCAGLAFPGSQVIRGPYIDPFQEDVNNFSSYYYYTYGNALFVFINDWHGGAIVGNINSAGYAAMKQTIESTLKEHRHKYKWCFTFTHTSVDAVDPDNSGGAANTIAENATTQSWLMNLHSTYRVTAHFSGHYHGWRVKNHSNGTLYINCNFGSSTASSSNSEWNNTIAFANVKIGMDENGNVNEDKCKIDIVDAGVTGNQGTVLNTSSSVRGVANAYTDTIIDHRNRYVSVTDCNQRAEVVSLSTDWYYNSQSAISDLTDLVLTRRFMDIDYEIVMHNDLMSDSDKKLAWKIGRSPFYNTSISADLDTTTGGYLNRNLITSTSSSSISLPLSWQTGTALREDIINMPIYFRKTFDIPDTISVSELQIVYEFKDAAYVWINGMLAWYSDGEGMPDSTSPFVSTSRPELVPEKVDPESASFATNLVSLDTIPNTQDTVASNDDSHQRQPQLHYEMSGQPIKITDIDIIRSLKRTNNIIAVLIIQGGVSVLPFSNVLAFDAEVTALGRSRKSLHAPQITGPTYGSQFNRGSVLISWNISSPGTFSSDRSGDPYLDDENDITYEIEYTENYIGTSTNWHTLKRRIPYTQTEYDWKVGKMIKSSSVRVRIRAHNSSTEETSDWSISNKFSINIFELIAPAIVSPISGRVYSDFMFIILNESLTRYTYNQKVRYTLEYSSQKQQIDWTIIKSNLPFGQNIIRWDISGLTSSDDYALRLTAKNTSTCQEPSTDEPDQIAKRYIYNINVQQNGVFIIDTKPPTAVLKIDNAATVSNQLDQPITIYAEDEATQVEQIQFRECDASSILSLGDFEDPYDPLGGCKSLKDLLSGTPDFNNLIGKGTTFTPKIKWTFKDTSGLRKLEAMLTDSGGNISLQEENRVFLTIYESVVELTDFIIVIEQRDKVVLDTTSTLPNFVIEPSIFEVVYFGTTSGQLYVLDPFPKLLYTIDASSITTLSEFGSGIYIFTYNAVTDTGRAYRHGTAGPELLTTFSGTVSSASSTSIFNDVLYIGMLNGKLWGYTGSSFSVIHAFADPISSLFSDREYLYIGFENSDSLVLYNGSAFTTLDF